LYFLNTNSLNAGKLEGGAGLAPAHNIIPSGSNSRVLKKAFLAFFNCGLSEINSYKPFKLLELKICAIWRYFRVPLRSVFFQHASKKQIISAFFPADTECYHPSLLQSSFASANTVPTVKEGKE